MAPAMIPPEITRTARAPLNITAVLLGDRIAHGLPVRAIRIAAAAVFVVLGILTIAGIGG